MVSDVEIHRLRAEDVDAAYDLIAEWETAIYRGPELTRGMFSNLVTIAEAAYVADTRSGIAGTASLRGQGADVLVRRSNRRRGIGTRLLRTIEEVATGEVLRLVTVTLEPAAAPFLVANGYAKAWEVWLMGVDLEAESSAPEGPEGISLRTFRREDASAVKELLDEAYAEEAHHVPLLFDDWRAFMLGDPSYDPDVWFLAVAGDRVVGAALNWKGGYVKDLVVHPQWRGPGLGKALMLQTFREFARRGVPRVTLKTDSNNPTQAWRLYERLGMRIERTYEVFEKRL
jgi:ribosomal protein S18 acetylase RimI-like enzyme